MDTTAFKQLAMDNALSASNGRQAETSAPADNRRPLPEIVFGNSIQDKEIILPDEIIKGMLHQGSKMMLGGGSKSFKTWSLADLAISIAAGVPWWGREVKQGRVLYLNLEVQAPFFETRLQTIAAAKGVQLPEELAIWNLRGYCAAHNILLPNIAGRLQDESFKAIVVDPAYKIMTGGESGDEAVSALMNSIERLSTETGAAVIFGAHFSKGNASLKETIDRVSGSGVFARDPDAIVMMTKHAEDDAFVIDPILRNCAPIPPFCVRWQYPLMYATEELNPKDLKLPMGTRPERKIIEPKELLQHVSKLEDIKQTELQNLAISIGFTNRSARAAIDTLKREGKLHEFRRQKGGAIYLSQTHPALHDLTEL